MKKRNVRTLSLIVVTFTYLLIGAAVFDALEGQNNENVLEAIALVKHNFMAKYSVSEDDYKIMEVLILEKKPHVSGPQWKFGGSFYYALVVLALIGYGHSTPATRFGKAFTMAYAMAGIPMAMVMFQSMGERINKVYSVIIKKIRCWRNSDKTEATDLDLILVSVFTSSVVTLCGALLFHTQEGWSFFDSLYYSFITLSTIGFGDFVALQQESALHFRPSYVVCSFLFLLIGLATLSSAINLLVLRSMIISLEEEEELQDRNILYADRNSSTCINTGIIHEATSERDLAVLNIYDQDRDSMLTASVCSCTCHSVGKRDQYFRDLFGRFWTYLFGSGSGVGRYDSGVAKLNGDSDNSSNYYNNETQSITNRCRLKVKRASL